LIRVGIHLFHCRSRHAQAHDAREYDRRQQRLAVAESTTGVGSLQPSPPYIDEGDESIV
jgi:hypothetical protein